jgi:hypothetical protein
MLPRRLARIGIEQIHAASRLRFKVDHLGSSNALMMS